MEQQSGQTDVIIIGGGLAGLSAAAYLARAGVAVTVFEKAANLGGRAATSNHDGYSFNRGVHALYCGGATEEVLRELDITYSGRGPESFQLLHQNKLHALPSDLSSLLRDRLLSLGDKLEFLRFFSTLSKLNPQDFAHVSVQEWIERTFRRPRLRQLMTSLACTSVYSSALDLVSAEVHIKKFQLSAKNSIVYIDGGWQTLVDGLRKVAEQAGARILSGTRVEAVEHQNGRVQGVRLRDGNLLHASAVIIATGPQDALKLVDAGAYTPLRQIVDGFVPARVACLDLALRHLPNPRAPLVQDMEHPRFFSTQSLSSRVAPEGAALIYAFKQLDPRNPGDPRENERDLENLLDMMQPGWRDVLVKRSYLPHIEAMGMLPTARSGGYASRPGPQVPGIAHLYLAGDWIGEGLLADPSLSSARQIAHHLLQGNLFSNTQKKMLFK